MRDWVKKESRGCIPKDQSTLQRMERKLRTKQEKRLYAVLAERQGGEALRGKEGMIAAPRLPTCLQAITVGIREETGRI